MDFQTLKYIYKPSGNPDAYTLLLLHGTGGDERDLIPLSQNFGDAYNILSLRGNVSENGMPRFFKRLGMGIFDEADLHFRSDEMVSFINETAIKEGFNSKKIIAVGYSNGANIAGAIMVKYPHFFAGAILYRPMQPFKSIEDSNEDSNTKIFFSSGQLDPTVDIKTTLKYIDILKRKGLNITFHEIPAGHQLTQQDVMLSERWLSENFH
ncbi:alpha/beta hydrolase [Flavobacterium sp. MFBS3-15]|uniref:alpha/beta hydrolase n=1 Tax=Flavobacterium sp. MFBS3-15 TaxID=2989816 RepID=UPI0022368833|nr:alpha/beta hydrolase [Flavobacterium sp. MFBS3-15]MCW4468871.1 alpha/beta hydrolase [Flavobacterium sp. MFBS3-15]